jgi:DNA-directed RNA polymerase subunit K/omega
MRAYRFTPTLAHIIYARARNLNMNESEFVRKVLMDAIKEIK